MDQMDQLDQGDQGEQPEVDKRPEQRATAEQTQVDMKADVSKIKNTQTRNVISAALYHMKDASVAMIARALMWTLQRVDAVETMNINQQAQIDALKSDVALLKANVTIRVGL